MLDSYLMLGLNWEKVFAQPLAEAIETLEDWQAAIALKIMRSNQKREPKFHEYCRLLTEVTKEMCRQKGVVYEGNKTAQLKDWSLERENLTKIKRAMLF